MNMAELTATQLRILDVLSDGRTHTKKELMKCLDDELAGKTALSFHITHIRKQLKKHGEDVVFVIEGHRGWGYRHVRCISTSDR